MKPKFNNPHKWEPVYHGDKTCSGVPRAYRCSQCGKRHEGTHPPQTQRCKK